MTRSISASTTTPARQRSSAPSPYRIARAGGTPPALHEPLSYSLEFRRGGEEKLTARMLPGTPIAGKLLCWTSTYAEIVENERIVFFQTLDVDQTRVSAAVVTVKITAEAGRTEVALTHQ